ncbi:uroporphyrinogen decarboxylase [Candidatus Palauibacter sp.]|uniref:uroporphyrinogen decarboxylase n=1 Tax=Candidatus Palauibacter sp. TaxID=3101350 RepID=UPI003B0248C5
MNDLLLRTLAREPVERTPVWFMRQAGRSLPAYRELRRERGFLELVRDPESAARVTRLPLDYFDVDALVLFMDLSTPFEAAGIEVELRPGVGPVPLPPWEGLEDVDRLRPFEPRERLDFVLEAIRLLASDGERPVIGFVGAPFTLCSYLARGPRDSRLTQLRGLILRRPGLWDRLAGFWAEHLAEFAIAQHEAGAGAIQVFDSWCSVLDPGTYRARVLPYSRRLLQRLAERGVPTVHYGAAHEAFAEAGGDAIGVDWRVPLDEAWRRIGTDRAIQGNLDPACILAGEEVARAGTRDVLRQAAGRSGHIFNLGHGLHPDSDPEVIAAVVDEVRRWKLPGR